MKKKKFIKIAVEPPGPKAKEIIERDRNLLMQSYVRWFPFVIKRGEGAIVEDVDGNRYIDMNAGIAVLATGHRDPIVLAAVKEQLNNFQHYSLTDFYYELAVAYAEKLFNAMPWNDNKIFYTNSGAESIEAAIKVSKGFFEGKRNYFIAFTGAFHGRTIGSLSLTGSKPIHKKYFFPMMPGVIHTPFPYCYRCPFRLQYPSCNFYCLDFMKEWILEKYLPSEEVAAIFIEPIQGEGGYVPAPKGYFKRLRKIADEYGILLVSDEVQSGMGRTGKLLAIENYEVRPDLITLAKGIASGFPLGALVGKMDVMNLPPGTHANTFGGNPVSLAAASATLDRLLNGFMDNAREMGDYLLKRLFELKDVYEIIGDVRGIGLMIGVELVKDRETKEPAKKELSKLIEYTFKHGVLIIGAGVSSVRFSPPLNISEEQIDEALDVFEDGLKHISREA